MSDVDPFQGLYNLEAEVLGRKKAELSAAMHLDLSDIDSILNLENPALSSLITLSGHYHDKNLQLVVWDEENRSASAIKGLMEAGLSQEGFSQPTNEARNSMYNTPLDDYLESLLTTVEITRRDNKKLAVIDVKQGEVSVIETGPRQEEVEQVASTPEEAQLPRLTGEQLKIIESLANDPSVAWYVDYFERGFDSGNRDRGRPERVSTMEMPRKVDNLFREANWYHAHAPGPLLKLTYSGPDGDKIFNRVNGASCVYQVGREGWQILGLIMVSPKGYSGRESVNLSVAIPPNQELQEQVDRLVESPHSVLGLFKRLTPNNLSELADDVNMPLVLSPEVISEMFPEPKEKLSTPQRPKVEPPKRRGLWHNRG